MFLVLFALLVSSARYGTISYEDCRYIDFDADYCKEAEVMHDTNEFLSKL